MEAEQNKNEPSVHFIWISARQEEMARIHLDKYALEQEGLLKTCSARVISTKWFNLLSVSMLLAEEAMTRLWQSCNRIEQLQADLAVRTDMVVKAMSKAEALERRIKAMLREVPNGGASADVASPTSTGLRPHTPTGRPPDMTSPRYVRRSSVTPREAPLQNPDSRESGSPEGEDGSSGANSIIELTFEAERLKAELAIQRRDREEMEKRNAGLKESTKKLEEKHAMIVAMMNKQEDETSEALVELDDQNRELQQQNSSLQSRIKELENLVASLKQSSDPHSNSNPNFPVAYSPPQTPQSDRSTSSSEGNRQHQLQLQPQPQPRRNSVVNPGTLSRAQSKMTLGEGTTTGGKSKGQKVRILEAEDREEKSTDQAVPSRSRRNSMAVPSGGAKRRASVSVPPISSSRRNSVAFLNDSDAAAAAAAATAAALESASHKLSKNSGGSGSNPPPPLTRRRGSVFSAASTNLGDADTSLPPLTAPPRKFSTVGVAIGIGGSGVGDETPTAPKLTNGTFESRRAIANFKVLAKKVMVQICKDKVEALERSGIDEAHSIILKRRVDVRVQSLARWESKRAMLLSTLVRRASNVPPPPPLPPQPQPSGLAAHHSAEKLTTEKPIVPSLPILSANQQSPFNFEDSASSSRGFTREGPGLQISFGSSAFSTGQSVTGGINGGAKTSARSRPRGGLVFD